MTPSTQYGAATTGDSYDDGVGIKSTFDDDCGFTKTVVLVKLMRYGDDEFVSWSRA